MTFTIDWSGTCDEIQDFGSFPEIGWGRFQLLEDQCLRNYTSHVHVQSKRMYMNVLLRHLSQDGNNVIKWCQLGRKLLNHVTPKMFIKSAWPQFIYNDDETRALMQIKTIAEFVAKNKRLFGFGVAEFIQCLVNIRQFRDAIGWLKVFDGPLFTFEERRSAFWAVIQKFDWSEHTYMIAVISEAEPLDIQSQHVELCSMMTPRDLQMLADCDMDDLSADVEQTNQDAQRTN
ncbi:hypothetical protein MIR68_003895 [Amoeboaphelidium protococcarum]|nr:hypothetical protein MIR68_003895 [Amoeboaphelidium protococcarum]